MKKSRDFLVNRLNVVSDSFHWPSYSIRKRTSYGKSKPVVSLETSIVGRIKSLAEKKVMNSVKIQKQSKGSERKRERLQVFEMRSTKHCVKSDFFTDEHIKVLRMIPNDKLVLKVKSLRKTAQPLLVRSPRYDESKVRLKSSLTQTEGVQTASLLDKLAKSVLT